MGAVKKMMLEEMEKEQKAREAKEKLYWDRVEEEERIEEERRIEQSIQDELEEERDESG